MTIIIIKLLTDYELVYAFVFINRFRLNQLEHYHHYY